MYCVCAAVCTVHLVCPCRFTKRVYVEMPDEGARRELVCHLLAQHGDHKVLLYLYLFLCLCLCLCLCLSCTLYSPPL